MPTSSFRAPLAPSKNISQHMTKLPLKYSQLLFKYYLSVLVQNVNCSHELSILQHPP